MNIKIVTQSILVLMLINGCSNEDLPEGDVSTIQNEQEKLTSIEQSKVVEKSVLPRGASQKIGSDLTQTNDFELAVKDGLLTTRINEAPLGLVLKELGRQAQIKIFINASVTEVFVTSNVEAMPLEQGIKELLSKQNYTLVYEDVDPSKNDSELIDQKQLTRIAELRIVSESEPVINVKSLSNHEILEEASSRQKERDLYAFKARVEDALADSDNIALEELKQEILNLENPEAAAELYDEAVEEYESESEEYQVGAVGVFGTATNSGQSSTQTATANNGQVSGSSQQQSQGSATNTQQNDMPELRGEAERAFATGDPLEINKVVRDVVTHNDIERAIDAFTAEAKQSGFLQ